MHGPPSVAAVQRWFGSNLRAARTRAGLTQAELAERGDLSLRYAQALEQGGRAPSFAVLVRLAALLEVEPAELLRRASTEPARRGRPAGTRDA